MMQVAAGYLDVLKAIRHDAWCGRRWSSGLGFSRDKSPRHCSPDEEYILSCPVYPFQGQLQGQLLTVRQQPTMANSVVSTANGSSSPAEKATPFRIWLCSHARTASNLLAKQFHDHPQLAFKRDSMMDAYLYGPEKLSNVRVPSIPGTENTTFQVSFDDLLHFISSAESAVSSA